MKKDIQNLKESFCKRVQCGSAFNKEEVGRVFGKESAPYLNGYCCARCYTLDVTSKPQETKSSINWISVETELPPASEKGFEETYVRGNSERVLLSCKDGVERFGRYAHHILNKWNIEGCCGQPADFVTHFAYLNKPASK